MSNEAMKCICCPMEGPIVDSHVISNFIRKAITGIDTPNGRKFQFRYVGRRDLPKQDLPKPKLLCENCDNKFGATIEGPAASVLIPKGDLASIAVWERLPLKYVTILEIEGQPLIAAQYRAEDDRSECALDKFTVLTAWRALHAMNANGDADAVDFLASDEGNRLQELTINFLNSSDHTNYLHFPYYSQLYFFGPKSAAIISGADDEVPFAWTFVRSGAQVGIAVLLGYWVILWSLLADDDPRTKFSELLIPTFVDWHAKVNRTLR